MKNEFEYNDEGYDAHGKDYVKTFKTREEAESFIKDRGNRTWVYTGCGYQSDDEPVDGMMPLKDYEIKEEDL